jgi:hypothetical protein
MAPHIHHLVPDLKAVTHHHHIAGNTRQRHSKYLFDL